MRVETDLGVEYVYAVITNFWVGNVRLCYDFYMLKRLMLKGEFPEFKVDLLMLLVAEKWRKNSWELSLELGEPKSIKIVLVMVVLHNLMVEC